MQRSIYLDHNATTPVDPAVVLKVPEWISAWGNPSSIHYAGRGPKAMLREARRAIAQHLNVDPLEIIFTAGGSEANNLALKGLVHAQAGRKQIIVSAIEHPSIRQSADALRAQGYVLDILPVSREGIVDFAWLKEHLSENTALVSVMLVNNETGHILPIEQIAAQAHSVGALVHCDAVQALGKLPLDLKTLGCDCASFSGHKFYALKGCGVLFARRGLALERQIDGGAQERHRRAGTENVLAITSLGFMCAEKSAEIAEQSARLTALRDHLERRVQAEIAGVTLTGAEGLRVGTTSNMTIEGIDGETLLMNLDVRGFAVSTGAACSSGSPEPSPVLLAMGLTRAEAQSSLRLSLGWGTQSGDIEVFVDELKSVVERLRGFRARRNEGS